MFSVVPYLASPVTWWGQIFRRKQTRHNRSRIAWLSMTSAGVTSAARTMRRFLVARQQAHVDFLDESIAQVSAEIAERVRPAEDAIARLDTIPGVGRSVAEALVAEIGADPARFPTAKHLAS